MWTSEQGLSFTLAVLYGSICVASGVQSARILLNRHSITSFQFAFHILCFLWTSLRTTFFASTAPLPRTLTLLIYWFPIDIQFATFSLMVVFYAYVIYKREWESKRALLLTVYIIANVTMFSLTTGIFYNTNTSSVYPLLIYL